jgi:hypothetical protein
MLNRIQTIDRFDFEEAFPSEVPYLLITIRKPGTKFVRVPAGSNCVEQCRLMFHENNGFRFNSRGVIMPLCERQATKLVEFVFHHRESAPLLVFQSEYASQQLIAIAKCIGRWLKIPVPWDDLHIEPDTPTLEVVQQAIARIENKTGDECFTERR